MVPSNEGLSNAVGPSSSTTKPKRFKIKKWNAVAFWAWGLGFRMRGSGADVGGSRMTLGIPAPFRAVLDSAKELLRFESDDSNFYLRLLVMRDLSLQLQVPTSTDTYLATTQLEKLVKASRILHLDEKELYFVEDDGPFSTINGLESLFIIWSSIECFKSDAKPVGVKVLQLLQELTSDKINALCPEYPDKETFKEEAEDGKELLKWGKANGMIADKLNITRTDNTILCFEGLLVWVLRTLSEYPDKETFKEEAEDGKMLLKWGKSNGVTADKLNISRSLG